MGESSLGADPAWPLPVLDAALRLDHGESHGSAQESEPESECPGGGTMSTGSSWAGDGTSIGAPCPGVSSFTVKEPVRTTARILTGFHLHGAGKEEHGWGERAEKGQEVSSPQAHKEQDWGSLLQIQKL